MKPFVTVLAIGAVVLAGSTLAVATVYTWDDGEAGNHNWTSPNNWDRDSSYPGATFPYTDDAIITTGNPAVMTASKTIVDLTMGGTSGVDVDGNTLAVSGTFTVNSGSTISITSTSTCGGITAGSIVINGASTVTVSGCTVQTN